MLTERFREVNIELDNVKKNQFLRYYDLLFEWNKRINLTSIIDFGEVIEKHFIDSLSIIHFIDIYEEQNMLDLGTGAGFPGIPLKIVFPEMEIVLIDSLRKRVDFLNEVIENLELKKISVIHGRAEDLAVNEYYREKFDLVVSRAVANLVLLSEYCIPFVKINGKFISYKSGVIDEEVREALKSIHIMGGKLNRVEKFKLLYSNSNRSFVIIDKKTDSPKQYPRKAGIPAKNPLK